MNRLPTKQIYLLSVIIVGIIALSVYSTYALFTFESSTSDIVTIHTPKSLKITENIYEYQQLVLEPNSIMTIDIDIYNTFDYEVCYSIWYKIIGDINVQDKIQIFEKNEQTLSSSGTLEPTANITVTIAFINDNDSEVKVNIGTIGASKEDDTCSLNLSTDKHTIASSYKNISSLMEHIMNKKEVNNEIEENYNIYENETKEIKFSPNDKIYISKEFTYEKELFTLVEPQNLTFKELLSEYNLVINDTYFCLNSNQCKILYKINEIKQNEKNEIIITNYNKYIGYSKGYNGLRQINETDYVFYGDNPNNFLYYNCENEDISTCELWRIVGFFYNQEQKDYNIKIVRNDSIGKYQYDYKVNNDINESTNNWNTSTLNKYLNEEYKLKNNYNIYINNHPQIVERIPDIDISLNDMKIPEEKIDSKISLLSLSDYLYTSSCKKENINEYSSDCFSNNWLNNIEISNEWTLTSKEVEELPLIEEETNTDDDLENEEPPAIDNVETENPDELENTENEEIEENTYIINYVYSAGNDIVEYDVNELLDVRPVLFLKSRMLFIDGEGTSTNPYIIK